MSDYTDVPYDDYQELQLPPPGKKADLTIVGIEEGYSKGDPEQGKPQRPMITCEIEFQDGSGNEYETIRHWLVFPNADEVEEAKENPDVRRSVGMMTRNLKRFYHMFGLKPSDIPEGLIGATGRGSVTHQPNPQDQLNPFVRLAVPRLPKES